MGFKDSLASFLDATRFPPFRVFNGYYVAYSTWIGAIFPLGCIVLLVLYGGSSFLAWARVPNSEDVRIEQLSPDLLFPMPQVGLTFYTDATGDGESFTETDPRTVLDVSAELCTVSYAEVSSTFVYDGASVTADRLQPTESCEAVGFLDGTPDDIKVCPFAALCADLNATVPSQQLQGSRSLPAGGRRFLRVIAKLANSSATVTNAVSGSRFALFVGNTVPQALLVKEDKEELAFNVSYLVPAEPTLLYRPEVSLEARRVLALPSYFGDEETFDFLQARGIKGRYGEQVGGDLTILSVEYAMEPTLTTTRLVPATLLFMIARFGQLIAALALCNVLIYRINFLSFFTVADDTYYVPDLTVRNFLMANKKLRVKEFENMLIYAFTFGGVDRFGVQTRHLHEFFNDKEYRYDRDRARTVVEDVQKFTATKRIGNFVNEERKVERLGDDSDYDIAAASGAAFTRTATLDGEDPEEEDDTEEGKSRALKIIREAETSLKLCVLHDELAKMKSIAATLFPTQAKRYRLAERLHGRYVAGGGSSGGSGGGGGGGNGGDDGGSGK
jgi:uncharacterized membrane protein YgcG